MTKKTYAVSDDRPADNTPGDERAPITDDQLNRLRELGADMEEVSGKEMTSREAQQLIDRLEARQSGET